MYNLSEAQIEKILNDIRIRGVETEDLQYNLLDHICCIIEQEYNEDIDFEIYCGEVIKRFYKRDLREIEEETQLLLTFKHYYAMKKIMIASGISSALSILVGAFFKFMHLPGAGILLVLGMAIFALVFLPLMFTLKFRESKQKREKFILLMAIPLCGFIVISVLFKIMHWPGANIMMQSSILFQILFFIPVFLLTGLRNPETKVNTITNSILMIAGAGLTMSLVTVMKSKDTIEKEIMAIERIDFSLKHRLEFSKNQLQSIRNDSSKNNDQERLNFLIATIALVDFLEMEKQTLVDQTGARELVSESSKSIPFYYNETVPRSNRALQNFIRENTSCMEEKKLPALQFDFHLPPGSSLLNAYQKLCDIQRDLLDNYQYIAFL